MPVSGLFLAIFVNHLLQLVENKIKTLSKFFFMVSVFENKENISQDVLLTNSCSNVHKLSQI